MLRGFDRPIADALLQQMVADGIHHAADFELAELREVVDPETRAKSISVLAANGVPELTGFDKVIFAIGRVPNVDENMLKLGLEMDAAGHLVVDKWQQTNVEGVYALGDVCGQWLLTPVAIAAGRKLGDRLFGGQPEALLEYHTIPTVMFSHPPIGMVGLTEEAAAAKYGADQVGIYQCKFRSMHFAMCPPNSAEWQAPSTIMRLIVAGPEDKVVGLHMMGPFVDEMLQGFSVAVRVGFAAIIDDGDGAGADDSDFSLLLPASNLSHQPSVRVRRWVPPRRTLTTSLPSTRELLSEILWCARMGISYPCSSTWHVRYGVVLPQDGRRGTGHAQDSPPLQALNTATSCQCFNFQLLIDTDLRISWLSWLLNCCYPVKQAPHSLEFSLNPGP